MSNSNDRNPFKFQENPELNRAADALLALERKFADLKLKAKQIEGFNGGLSFKPLIQIDLSDLDFYNFRSPYYNSHTQTYRLEELKKGFEALKAKTLQTIEEVEASNKEAIDHNAQIFKTIVTVMEALGVAQIYSIWEYPTARSKTKKEVKHIAGYIQDLRRVMPSTNVDKAKSMLASLEANITSLISNEQKSNQKKRLEKLQQDYDLIMGRPAVVAYLSKKGVNLSSSYWVTESKSESLRAVAKDMIDKDLSTVLEKNKYLHLAYYLEMNRSDWSEGPNYAEIGMNSFKVESELDQKIYDEISGFIKNWEGDGRVFRDCEYGYGFLYNMVKDEDLLKQFQEIRGLKMMFDY